MLAQQLTFLARQAATKLTPTLRPLSLVRLLASHSFTLRKLHQGRPCAVGLPAWPNESGKDFHVYLCMAFACSHILSRLLSSCTMSCHPYSSWPGKDCRACR